MVMKKDRRKRDIKSKLIAAIAMLMVSSIMVVSSSYAWFTLSTAPEVTGISTAIGANGNLEMALMPVSGNLADIGNADGSMGTVAKNTTWGNLVDLSDKTAYGLDKISLFPAALAISGNMISDYYLGTPKYGADGRFTELGNTASTAVYNNGSFGTNGFGVRAVGTASGMSAHELAYRDALASANDAFNQAITQTKNGAQQGGSALASLAVSKANNVTEYTQNDVNSLITAYEGIDDALTSIETALKQYVIANYLANGGLNDSTYLQELQNMESKKLSELTSYAGTTLSAHITALTTTQSTVDTNLAALKALEAKTGTNEDSTTYQYYEWAQFSSYLTALADTDKMLLNSKTIKYYMENNFANISELTSNMSNLVLEVNASETSADSGLYAKLADFVDDYTTPVTISGVSYGGITVNNLAVTMKVYATADPAYLPTAKTTAMNYGPTAFTGGGSTLSDFYGYIIDMAFRTNAVDSYLQLQTEAVDRIYDNNTSTDGSTMGGGSSITYTTTDADTFGTDALKKLMGFIRVVFFDPTDNTIFGYARLDATTADVVDNGNRSFSVTMDLKMWNPAANDNQGTWANSDAITQLVQNEAKAVSVLVYLDGENLTNADVANAELKGTMNIQFSSSAKLVPMEYGDLLNGNTQDTTEPSTPAATQMTNVGAPDGYATVAAFTGNAIAMTIANTDGTETVTVVIGGNTYNAVWNAANSAWAVSNIAETLAADTAITVTVAEAPAGG